MRLTFCVACGMDDASALEHHHLIPRVAGGGNDEANFITLCHTCHGKMHGYERAHVRRLTKIGLSVARARGEKFGNRTNLGEAQQLGAQANAQVADTFAANVLPIVEAIRRSGVSSLTGIAEALNARGIRTARGGAWYATTIRNLMARVPAESCSV